MALGTVAPYMPARLDDCRQLRECHLPANFIVSGRHAWWQPFVHGEQVGTAVAISKCDRDRHLAAKRRVSGLELVHFDNLLVWYKLHEASVVRVGVRRRLASPGQRIVRKRDPERAALAGVDRMHMARHTVRYLPLRDRPGVE